MAERQPECVAQHPAIRTQEVTRHAGSLLVLLYRADHGSQCNDQEGQHDESTDHDECDDHRTVRRMISAAPMP